MTTEEREAVIKQYDRVVAEMREKLLRANNFTIRTESELFPVGGRDGLVRHRVGSGYKLIIEADL